MSHDRPVALEPEGRRRYDSPLRREQAARTRERIVCAGAELVRELASWDWREVTVAAVAERAGVHERTVFRHFATEQLLRREVADRLEVAAGVVEGTPELTELSDVVRRLFRYLAQVPAVRTPPRVDPALAGVDRRRRDSILSAVTASAPDLPECEQRQVAAVLDALGSFPTFRRLVLAWELDVEDAARAASWAVDLVVAAVLDGVRPGGEVTS
jgi:AcrR family transcriptional regulator